MKIHFSCSNKMKNNHKFLSKYTKTKQTSLRMTHNRCPNQILNQAFICKMLSFKLLVTNKRGKIKLILILKRKSNREKMEKLLKYLNKQNINHLNKRSIHKLQFIVRSTYSHKINLLNNINMKAD